MFGWFKRDPKAGLQRKIDRKYDESVELQRNGRLREYGAVMKELQALEKQLEEMGAP